MIRLNLTICQRQYHFDVYEPFFVVIKKITFILRLVFRVLGLRYIKQVSLTLCWGYVPGKFQSTNTQTNILSLNYA